MIKDSFANNIMSMPTVLLLICFVAHSQAYFPTQQFTATTLLGHASTTTCRWQGQLISTYQPTPWLQPLCSAATSSVDYTEAEAQEQQEDTDNEDDTDQQDDQEEDTSETYRINVALSKLAARCARNGGRHSQSPYKPHPAMMAYQLLKTMTYRDTVAYNTVLKALAKSTPAMLMDIPDNTSNDGKSRPNKGRLPRISAAERAQSLLMEMVEQHEAQKAANRDWYERNASGTLTDDERSRGPPRVRVKPNVRSYSTVMDAWSRSGNVPATLSVLKALEDRYEASGHDVALQPNIFSYNTVLSAYSKSKGGRQGAEDCQAFMETMPVEPDTISYNCCLHAWARSGVSHAGESAEEVLRKMPMAPNTRSYTTVMDAWSRSRGGEGSASPAAHAHALLNELKDLYDQSGDVQVKPNCISYSTVINAYAMSKEPLKAQKAFELLQEMRARGNTDPYVLPNTVTYNSVLNACATSSPLSYTAQESSNGEDKGEKLTCCLQEMIQTLYKQLLLEQNSAAKDDSAESNNDNQNSQNYRKTTRLAPDHFTFGTVLKACANNIFWDDPQFGIRVFGEACRQGQVSLGVLVQLRQAVSTNTFQELLPAGAYNRKTKQFSMADIPDAWKRNVRGKERDGGGNQGRSPWRNSRNKK